MIASKVDKMSLNDKLAITQSLKQAAAELGIDKIGIAPAEPLKEEYDRFLKWIAAGMNGEMAWLARDPEKRFDPRRVFPEARSVIVAAVNYFPRSDILRIRPRARFPAMHGATIII